MEEKMATHDDKRGDEWKSFSERDLFDRLVDEYREFLRAVADKDKKKAKKELVDLANFSAMLYDKLDGGNQQ